MHSDQEERSIALFIVRAIHYFTTIAYYLIVFLAALIVGEFNVDAGCNLLIIFMAMLVVSLVLMSAQIVWHHVTQHKPAPLVVQVIDASEQHDLADEPLRWCWQLLRHKPATLLEHFVVWNMFPIIITLIEACRIWKWLRHNLF